MTELTHDMLGEIAAKYLKRRGWNFALSNLWSAMITEKPDCLAFDLYGNTFLVEAKMSRADFFADQKKWSRKRPELAAGSYRAYITPPGLLKVEEVPYGWQLWEVTPGKRPVVKVVKGQEFYKSQCPWSSSKRMIELKRFVNCDQTEFEHFAQSQSVLRRAYDWLLVIVRRAEASGIDMQQFAASDELWRKGRPAKND